MTSAMTPGTLSFSTATHSRKATPGGGWGERCLQATEAEAHDQVTYPLTPQRWSSIDHGKRFAGVST